MKFLCLMAVFVSTPVFAVWTAPEGITPVKQEVVKADVRHPASHTVKTEPTREKAGN